MRSPGFVYVMVNPRAPQLVRVGRTDRPPEDTARESNLQLRDAAYFSDAMTAEGFVHDYLETFHAGPDPEMFEVPIEIALKGLSMAMERHVGTRANLPVNPSLYDNEPVNRDGTTSASLFEQGVEQRRGGNPTVAIKYFKQAARMAEPRAFLALAEMTERGEGCRVDSGRALEWLHEGTRMSVRECWGALGDRHPHTKYLRPYFDGMELGALTPEQRPVVLRRMKVYVQAALAASEPADELVIDAALDQLKDRDIQREWQRSRGKSYSGGGMNPFLKWTVALLLAGGIGIAFPMLLQKYQSRGFAATAASSNDTTEAPDVIPTGTKAATPGSGSKTKARLKATPASQAAAQAHMKTPAPVAAVSSSPNAPNAKPSDSNAGKDAPRWETKTPPPVAEATPRHEISGTELREQYYWGKEKADGAFKDSEVKMSDTVVKVGKHDVSFKKIKCKFNGAPPASLVPGRTATVEGTVHGKRFWSGTITIENCRVLPQ